MFLNLSLGLSFFLLIKFGCNEKMHQLKIHSALSLKTCKQRLKKAEKIRKKNKQTKTRFCHFYGISYSLEGAWLNMASRFTCTLFMPTMNFAREWVINVTVIAIYNSFQLFNTTQIFNLWITKANYQSELQKRKSNEIIDIFGCNKMIYAVYLASKPFSHSLLVKNYFERIFFSVANVHRQTSYSFCSCLQTVHQTLAEDLLIVY